MNRQNDVFPNGITAALNAACPGMFRVRKTGSAKQSSVYSFPSGKMNGPPPARYELRSGAASGGTTTKPSVAYQEEIAENQGNTSVWSHSQLMWFLADVIGSSSLNAVSFSRNLVRDGPILSVNLVPEMPM